MSKVSLETLKAKVRAVTKEDEELLPRISHSKLEALDQCPYRYYLHYEQDKTSDKSSIALTLGGVIHEILEQKGKAVMRGELISNADTVREAMRENIDDVKSEFASEWRVPDKYGVTYDEKMDSFWKYYDSAIGEEDGWFVSGVEKKFYFVYDNRVRVLSFIDRLDSADGLKMRLTDYKTANHVYGQKELDYSQQFFLYALGCVHQFNYLPDEYEYDFVFLGEKASALTAEDSLEKCMKNVDARINTMFELQETRKYYPKTSPLCYYCPYCANNPTADPDLKNMCTYYSHWTPDDRKNFSANMSYDKETFNADDAFARAGFGDEEDIIW